MKHNIYNQRGVGMIEILVSLVILAVGLLSVATLHVGIINQSHESKARSEAIAIAESRIETMRNFGSAMKDVDDFNGTFATMTKGNSTAITGMNAAFTRMETIADNNDVKEINIYVQWTDKDNNAQEVTVSSSIAWATPRSSGDIADSLSGPLIPSATGRARLGDGTLPSGATTTPTGDGMRLYDSQDGDYRLVDANDTIVLTLNDACDLDTSVCTDFVEISGRVYIDKTKESSFIANTIYVKASDAAYCQLYYINGNGDPVDVTSSTTSVSSTAGNDYNYFNYTCYLGGGWHGNIGLILTGGGDKVCLGDPTSAQNFEKPKLSKRRVYRGMLHAIDSNGAPMLDANGDHIYYSIGVSDALQLPLTGEGGHDFVVTSDNGQTPDDFCTAENIMTRTDSKTDIDGNVTNTFGMLFENVPTSFYCLNEDADNLDYFDPNIYAAYNYCPFDPSDPPVSRHEISGTVLVNSVAEVDDLVTSMYLSTSDGAGNCTTNTFTKPTATQYAITYVCNIYDWGTGWDGYIQLNTDYSLMACTHQTAYSSITSDTDAVDNTCTVANSGGSGDILTVRGNVTTYTQGQTEKLLVSASISDAGQCDITNGTSYECNSAIIPVGSAFNGTMTFSTDGNKLCIADIVVATGTVTINDGSSTATVVFAGVEPEVISVDFTLLKNGNCL
jgi:type IV pilus modification protein PilV